MEKKNLEKENQKSKKQASFLQYSNMAMQMFITIGLFIFIGIKMDAWLETKVAFTLIGSLLGVFLSLYTFIKRVLSENE